MFVRPIKGWPLLTRNFQLVLLDHGLYRQIPTEMRLNYAKLWLSILNKDEDSLLKCSSALMPSLNETTADGSIHYHRLLASMISGKTWSTLFSSKTSTFKPSPQELSEIQRDLSTSRFFFAIVDILSSVDRRVLLLLKTGDLLKGVDEALGVAGDLKHHLSKTLGTQGWYCAKAVFDEKRGLEWLLGIRDYLSSCMRLIWLNCYLLLF